MCYSSLHFWCNGRGRNSKESTHTKTPDANPNQQVYKVGCDQFTRGETSLNNPELKQLEILVKNKGCMMAKGGLILRRWSDRGHGYVMWNGETDAGLHFPRCVHTSDHAFDLVKFSCGQITWRHSSESLIYWHSSWSRIHWHSSLSLIHWHSSQSLIHRHSSWYLICWHFSWPLVCHSWPLEGLSKTRVLNWETFVLLCDIGLLERCRLWIVAIEICIIIK